MRVCPVGLSSLAASLVLPTRCQQHILSLPLPLQAEARNTPDVTKGTQKAKLSLPQLENSTLTPVCVQGLVTQPCPTLQDPMDSSPPGSSVHGILQARILEWVPRPSPGDLPHPGIEPRSPSLQADSLPAEPPGEPFKDERQTR